MSATTQPMVQEQRSSSGGGLLEKLNGPWHKTALIVFLVITLFHWAEHIFQAVEIWGLGMARPEARGALGMLWPWLVSSEWLHYGYAIVMLAFLIVLRPGFVGRGRTWWDIAIVIQFWHHIEHFLLLGQVMTGKFLFGGAGPVSIVQHWVPRVELHLFYNAIVFIPMLIAMYYHVRPPAGETPAHCSCVVKSPAAT